MQWLVRRKPSGFCPLTALFQHLPVFLANLSSFFEWYYKAPSRNDMGSKVKREKGEEDDIVDKNLRCLQALSWNITSVVRDMAAATEAASPLEKGPYWEMPLSCQRQKFVGWQVGIARTGFKAEASTSASWWETLEPTMLTLNSSNVNLPGKDGWACLRMSDVWQFPRSVWKIFGSVPQNSR